MENTSDNKKPYKVGELIFLLELFIIFVRENNLGCVCVLFVGLYGYFFLINIKFGNIF